MVLELFENPFRGNGLRDNASVADGWIVSDPAAVRTLLAQCHVAKETPLLDEKSLANELGVSQLFLKDERERMGLGSFKALGAAHAIAKQAQAVVDTGRQSDHTRALSDVTFVCASAGNHGLSMAAGAAVFGARAVVYLCETVPEDFVRRLAAKGADVVRAGADYEASLEAAKAAAQSNGWSLLSDTTWPGYTQPAIDVMEGYLIMAEEAADQLASHGRTMPTHIFLQAGVGGLAAACAVVARRRWGGQPKICVVEPSAAPALAVSIQGGRPVMANGPVSNMGRLDCKEPSHLALKALAQDADFFVTIADEDASETVAWLDGRGVRSSPSGAAGVAALRHASSDAREKLGITVASRVLCYVSEGPPDG